MDASNVCALPAGSGNLEFNHLSWMRPLTKSHHGFQRPGIVMQATASIPAPGAGPTTPAALCCSNGQLRQSNQACGAAIRFTPGLISSSTSCPTFSLPSAAVPGTKYMVSMGQ